MNIRTEFIVFPPLPRGKKRSEIGGEPQAWDRYAFVYNNTVRYVDPSGHRTCTTAQAVTGDETCDQNLDAQGLENLLTFYYGWEFNGNWSKEKLLLILDVGKAIRRYISELTGIDNNNWIRQYLGDASFHTGYFSTIINRIVGAQGMVLWEDSVFLPSRFNAETVAHELAHVLDNNWPDQVRPNTWFGGGAADAMLTFVRGNPGGCVPRFHCLTPESYIDKIAGNEAWPSSDYIANHGVADDFAQTFAYAIYDPTRVPALRLLWMNNFMIVTASSLH